MLQGLGAGAPDTDGAETVGTEIVAITRHLPRLWVAEPQHRVANHDHVAATTGALTPPPLTIVPLRESPSSKRPGSAALEVGVHARHARVPGDLQVAARRAAEHHRSPRRLIRRWYPASSRRNRNACRAGPPRSDLFCSSAGGAPIPHVCRFLGAHRARGPVGDGCSRGASAGSERPRGGARSSGDRAPAVST